VIVGFSRYGKGGGSGPVQYLTSERNTDGTPRTPPPKVLQGDPTLISRLIDALPFKHRYSSGVLSFAPGEIVSPEMERDIMHDFERVAFAGLEGDRYAILWVRHQHAGHHELHFLVPRTELSTGKSMNIHPPGKASQKLFDLFRSMVNARYGLADPDDPRRARDVSLPNHIAKLKADGARKGKKLQDDIREVISESVRREVAAGRIADRNGVVRYLESQGFIINRQGENYISVIDSPGGTKIRLKGNLYAEGPLDAVRANMEQETPIQDKPDLEKAAALSEKLERMISTRAEYNSKRYGTTEQGGEPQRGESLREYLRRNLGADALRPRRWQGYGYEQGRQR
jgi:hypothetical protein